MHALIIDSAEVVATRLHDLLDEMNCFQNISFADNYNEAVAQIDDNTPDVVLLDIQLPDNSGIELLKLIKQKHPCLKVIVLTNKSSETYRNICEQIGSDHFIDKSTSFENITSIIRSYLT
ncbi:MAG: response regulator transcription factor [Ferruginibacter sp.]